MYAAIFMFFSALCLVARAIRNAIRANQFARIAFAIETPIFIARQADSESDSHESLEFPIRANHATKALRKGVRSPENRRHEVKFPPPSVPPPEALYEFCVSEWPFGDYIAGSQIECTGQFSGRLASNLLSFPSLSWSRVRLLWCLYVILDLQCAQVSAL